MGKSLNGKELGVGMTQNKDGTYVGRFTDHLGKRRSFYGKNCAVVKKRLQDARDFDDDNKNCIYDSNITLDEWVDVWKSVCKVNCRETTIRSYEEAYKRIQKTLGRKKLQDLNYVIIQRAFNELNTDASRKKSKDILVDILNCAVDAEIIPKNPAVRIRTKINGEEKRERRILSDEEIDLVLHKAKEINNRLYPILTVGFNTGMRIGEILGLTWDNVDFNSNVIHVRKTLAYVYSVDDPHFLFNPPKTKAGIRDIPMTKAAKTALLEQRMKCNIIYSRHDPLPGFENLVFPGTQNTPIDATHIGGGIKTILRNLDKDGNHVDHFSPHCMRHTFATKCIARGMKPKVLQRILGHQSLTMTMDLYCHVEDNTVRDEMALFASLA